MKGEGWLKHSETPPKRTGKRMVKREVEEVDDNGYVIFKTEWVEEDAPDLVIFCVWLISLFFFLLTNLQPPPVSPLKLKRDRDEAASASAPGAKEKKTKAAAAAIAAAASEPKESKKQSSSGSISSFFQRKK